MDLSRYSGLLEEELRDMLDATPDYEERRKIRTMLRQVKKESNVHKADSQPAKCQLYTTSYVRPGGGHMTPSSKGVTKPQEKPSIKSASIKQITKSENQIKSSPLPKQTPRSELQRTPKFETKETLKYHPKQSAISDLMHTSKSELKQTPKAEVNYNRSRNRGTNGVHPLNSAVDLTNGHDISLENPFSNRHTLSATTDNKTTNKHSQLPNAVTINVDYNQNDTSFKSAADPDGNNHREHTCTRNYEQIEDEDSLNKMLKECTILDERLKIRSALRKLRERKRNAKLERSSGVVTGSIQRTQSLKARTSPQAKASLLRSNSLTLTEHPPPDDTRLHTNGYNPLITQNTHSTHDEKVKHLEQKLSNCNDFDERRRLRSSIRELRSQTRNDKEFSRDITPPTNVIRKNEKNTSSMNNPAFTIAAFVKDKQSMEIMRSNSFDLFGNGHKLDDNTSSVLSITNTLQNQAVEDGGSVCLELRLSAKPSGKVTWKKDESLLDMSGFRHEIKDCHIRLHIDELYPDDEGYYSCEVENPMGKSLHSQMYLKVNDAGQAPVIDEYLTDMVVPVGRALVLQCRLQSTPPPSICWYHEDVKLNPSSRYCQTYDGTTAMLMVRQTFLSDAGVYSCHAKNSIGESACSCIVTVTDGNPSLILRDQPDGPKNAWSTATKCDEVCETKSPDNTKGTLTSQSTTDRDTSEQVTSSVTEIVSSSCSVETSTPELLQQHEPEGNAEDEPERSSTSEEDMEESSTESSTDDSTGSSSEEEEEEEEEEESSETTESDEVDTCQCPEFTNTLKDQEVTLSTDLVLVCMVTAIPDPDVKWIKDGRAVPKGRSSSFRQSYDEGLATLTVRDVIRRDGGQYTCVASNSEGEAMCSCNVSITDKKKTQAKPAETSEDNLGDYAISEIRRTNGTPSMGALAALGVTMNRQIHRRDIVRRRIQEESVMADSELPGMDQLDSITDDEVLHKMMNKTESFDERKKIRARLREIRDLQDAKLAAKKKEREEAREDAVKMRQRQAEAEKQRKLKGFENRAKETTTSQRVSHDAIKERHQAAEEEKQRKLDQFKEMGKTMAAAYSAGTDYKTREDLKKAEEDKSKMFQEEAVSRSTRTEQGVDGNTTTTTTTSTEKSKDGKTTVTKQTKQISSVGGLGGTSYTINKQTADETADRLVNTFAHKGYPTSSGEIKVKTETWSTRDGTTRRAEKTKTWGGKSESAMNTFKSMDAASPAGRGRGGKVAIQRSPSAIKDMLLAWVKQQVDGYPNVNVTNFSTSWNNGMAFCALIHRFYPNSFDFNKLDPKRRRGNFKLGFDMAEKLAGIAPLLEVDDMVRYEKPDWKCVFCSVQSYYRRFRDWDDEKEKAKAAA